MAKQLFANNVSVTINEELSATDITITVSSTASFPAISGGDWIIATIVPAGGQGSREVVKITAFSGNALTVVRGQEGTTGQSFQFGSILELRVTKGTLEYLRDTPTTTAFTDTLLDDVDAATARTTLGLGTISTQNSSSVSITGGTITGITDLSVADGGTGASTFTDGGVLVGNAAGAIQVTSAGTSGQFLKSGGAGVDPAFANIAGTDITSGDIAAARITGALNAAGSAPIFACRAWVSFNGTGVVAINASGNVSSITDNGTGNYQVNFTTALQDANYAVVGQAGKLLIDDATNCLVVGVSSKTVSAMRFIVVDNNTDTATDASDVGIAIFR